MPRSWWVYILTNRSGTLYIGVTGDLAARLTQHRSGLGSRFARRYAMTRLVFVEESPDPYDAIRREKQLKSWSRARKVALINAANPEWEDLGNTCFREPEVILRRSRRIWPRRSGAGSFAALRMTAGAG